VLIKVLNVPHKDPLLFKKQLQLPDLQYVFSPKSTPVNTSTSKPKSTPTPTSTSTSTSNSTVTSRSTSTTSLMSSTSTSTPPSPTPEKSEHLEEDTKKKREFDLN
jgi:hypothetical protein